MKHVCARDAYGGTCSENMETLFIEVEDCYSRAANIHDYIIGI